MNRVLARNIAALHGLRRERAEARTPVVRAIDAITAFAGSLTFVILHAVILVAWLVANTGHLGMRPWDPYPFVMLAMAASVEAIFISTFVLIGQNRQSLEADRRAELNLQIDLLAEHEVTRLIEMVEAIARKMEIVVAVPDLGEIRQDISPESVMAELDRTEPT